MNDDVFLEDDDLRDEADAPFWTLPRLVYAVFLIVILIAFLVYTLAPTIQAIFSPYRHHPSPCLLTESKRASRRTPQKKF